jgi:hypothetical protein
MYIKIKIYNNIMSTTTTAKFFCEKCVYSTCFKQTFETHLKSKRHNENQQFSFHCSICNKGYKSYQGLNKHNKTKCIIEESNNTSKIPENTKITETPDLIETIKKQGELIETMMATMKEINEKPFVNNHHNNNNIITINKTINNITILNILKNNYNDVISFEEFIQNIHIRYSDIEDIKDTDTCIKSLKNIIVNRLKEYQINERPFHCIMDEDENAETFLKQTEWIQEFMKDFDTVTPVLDTKIMKFLAKVNSDIGIMNITEDKKMEFKKILRTMTTRLNIEEIKTAIFYGIEINKYELNHNLLDNSTKNIILF